MFIRTKFHINRLTQTYFTAFYTDFPITPRKVFHHSDTLLKHVYLSSPVNNGITMSEVNRYFLSMGFYFF